MSNPARVNLTIFEGDDFHLGLCLRHDDGTILNTTGYDGTFNVYPDEDYDATAVVSLSVTGGEISVGIEAVDLAVTTTSASSAKGTTTVQVTTATGFAIGEHILIELDDDSFQEVEITNVIGTSIIIKDALVGAAASGNTIRCIDSRYAPYNFYTHLSAADTSVATEWGRGVYDLDLIDPIGRVQRLMFGNCMLQEGTDHV